jgi:hypothetical protein
VGCDRYAYGMAKETATKQTGIRLPSDWTERLEAIAARLSRPGLQLSVADAMRTCIAEGMLLLEKQLELPTPPTAQPEPAKRVRK